MTDADLTAELSPVVEGLGLALVECRSQGVRGVLHVHVVVHRLGGVSIDDCAEVHRTIVPRLELLTDHRDIHVEVSSPGISRKLKENREFPIFVGTKMKVMDMANEWKYGLLEAADDEGIVLNVDGTNERLAYPEIRAARLEDT